MFIDELVCQINTWGKAGYGWLILQEFFFKGGSLQIKWYFSFKFKIIVDPVDIELKGTQHVKISDRPLDLSNDMLSK